MPVLIAKNTGKYILRVSCKRWVFKNCNDEYCMSVTAIVFFIHCFSYCYEMWNKFILFFNWNRKCNRLRIKIKHFCLVISRWWRFRLSSDRHFSRPLLHSRSNFCGPFHPLPLSTTTTPRAIPIERRYKRYWLTRWSRRCRRNCSWLICWKKHLHNYFEVICKRYCTR